MKRGKAAWIRIAQNRILKVLKTRIAANTRQLEVKICEAGPEDIRPDPLNLSAGLQNLLTSKEVITIKRGKDEDSAFYALASTDPTIVQNRIDELLILVRLHRTFALQNEYSADILEAVIHSSFMSVAGCVFLGRLPPHAPLDGVYTLHGSTVGVEAKNTREWVYPWSDRIWGMVRKCLEINALPLLVARKMAWITQYWLFPRLGIIGFAFENQVFSVHTEEHLGKIRHKDYLGYKDVVTMNPSTPHAPLVSFLTYSLPRLIPERTGTWVFRRDLLREFAVDRDLANSNTPPKQRQRHVKDLMDQLR